MWLNYLRIFNVALQVLPYVQPPMEISIEWIIFVDAMLKYVLLLSRWKGESLGAVIGQCFVSHWLPIVSIFGHTSSRKTNSCIQECSQCLQLVHSPFTNLCVNLRDTCEPCGLFWVSARHLQSSTNMQLAGDRRWHAGFCMHLQNWRSDVWVLLHTQPHRWQSTTTLRLMKPTSESRIK